MPKKHPLKILLYPFSIIYGIIVSIRNSFFDYNILPSHEFDIPIISVGNITVGGTGKTPVVEYLIRMLKEDFRVATLSRGYKRKTRHFILASPDSTVHEIGDEPRQIKTKFPDIDVAVENNRVKGITNLISGNDNLNVILLDDAFQHRYVKPGISILLIDYNLPFFNDHLLPFGRLRESPYQKKRANIVIATKSPRELKPIERRIFEKNLNLFPYQSFYFTYLKHGEITPVFDPSFSISSEEIKEKKYSIVLVTGIANPAYFLKHLKKISDDIIHIRFNDHHYYSEKDITNIIQRYNETDNDNKIIVTTEKDAIRIRELNGMNELNKLPVYYYPVEIEFSNNEGKTFDKQIIDYVRKNKRNRGSHKEQDKV